METPACNSAAPTISGTTLCVGVAPFQNIPVGSHVRFPFSVLTLNYLVYLTDAFFQAIARDIMLSCNQCLTLSLYPVLLAVSLLLFFSVPHSFYCSFSVCVGYCLQGFSAYFTINSHAVLLSWCFGIVVLF